MLKYFISIGLISFLVIALVIYAFYSIGGPGKTRNEKFDQTRVQHIQSLKSSIENHYYQTGKLPDSISGIKTQYNNPQDLKDPENNKPYEYKQTGDKNYQICATFSTAFDETKDKNAYYNEQFKHPKGYYCFDLKIEALSNNAPPSNYSNFISSTAYQYQPYNKSRVAQSFKIDSEKSIKGIRSRFVFKNPYATRKKEPSKIVLKELTNEENPDEGPTIASTEFLPKIDEEYETDVLFSQPIRLEPSKKYIIIFEVSGNDTMNLFYSDKNPDPNGNLYEFNSSNLPNSDPDIFVWRKYNDRDIFYDLINN